MFIAIQINQSGINVVRRKKMREIKTIKKERKKIHNVKKHGKQKWNENDILIRC